MKIFKGYCDQRFGYGAYKQTHAVVVANTHSEALGMLLQEYSDTLPQDWEVDELSSVGVHHVASFEN